VELLIPITKIFVADNELNAVSAKPPLTNVVPVKSASSLEFNGKPNEKYKLTKLSVELFL